MNEETAYQMGKTIRFVAGCALAAFILWEFYSLVTFQGHLNQ